MSDIVTPRQRRAIESLLTTADTTQAAELAGVSRQTIYRWMTEPQFNQALKAGTTAALDGISRNLVSTAKKAVRELDKILDGPDPRPKARAADIVLARLMQLRELVDLEARITELEKRVR